MEDIITALATAWGESGISIVRISGEGCVDLADKLFSSKHKLAEYPPRYLSLGKLCTKNGEFFDEILAVRFQKDASYTGEESVELHCHGGTVASNKCIEELCRLGARIALPGEFTRRSFTNGRIDLAQAEAVLGIIRAKSDEALLASNRTLQGNFSEEIKNFLEKLTKIAAQLEVDLDFPEEEEGLLPRSEASLILDKLIDEGQNLSMKCRSGLVLREGIKAAIVGKPNVGKSSLLNSLLCEQRAIVTHIPGTTRDNIEETVIYRGIPIRFIDTAGIRKSDDLVESIGISRSKKSIEQADICIWVLDSSEPITDEDIELWNLIRDIPHILVLNKNDLPACNNEKILNEISTENNIVSISALHSNGTDELKKLIIHNFTFTEVLEESYGVTSRQMNSIQNALSGLAAAKEAMESHIGDDIVISCLSESRLSLAEVIGLDPTEYLIDMIFRDFCVGK